MKKITTIIAFLSLCISISTQAQNKNAFFIELLGNGFIVSANFDTRFTSNMNGIGGRIGIGYIGSPDEGSILTVPIMGNFLLGNDGKYFEIGAGVTIISGDGELFDDNVSEVVGTLSFMYRRQPVNGGFMWKIGITPFLADGFFIPYWVGLGLGYSW